MKKENYSLIISQQIHYRHIFLDYQNKDVKQSIFLQFFLETRLHI